MDKNSNIDIDSATNVDEPEEDEEKHFEASKVFRKFTPTSLVWKFFLFKGTKLKGPDDSNVVCKLCLDSDDQARCNKSIPYSNSTSNLLDHLKKHHKAEYDIMPKLRKKRKVLVKTKLQTTQSTPITMLRNGRNHPQSGLE